MARDYRILPGASFRRDDGTLATGGDIIELEDDVAARWHASVEPVKAATIESPAPSDEHAD